MRNGPKIAESAAEAVPEPVRAQTTPRVALMAGHIHRHWFNAPAATGCRGQSCALALQSEMDITEVELHAGGMQRRNSLGSDPVGSAAQASAASAGRAPAGEQGNEKTDEAVSFSGFCNSDAKIVRSPKRKLARVGVPGTARRLLLASRSTHCSRKTEETTYDRCE